MAFRKSSPGVCISNCPSSPKASKDGAMECPLLRLTKLVLNGFVDEEMAGLTASPDSSSGPGIIPRERVVAGMKMIKAIMKGRAFIVKHASLRTAEVNLSEELWFTTSEKTKSNIKSTFGEINNGFTGAFTLLNRFSCVRKVYIY